MYKKTALFVEEDFPNKCFFCVLTWRDELFFNFFNFHKRQKMVCFSPLDSLVFSDNIMVIFGYQWSTQQFMIIISRWRPGANQVVCFSFCPTPSTMIKAILMMKDKKGWKDVEDDHERMEKGFGGSRWGFGARGQSSGLFFPSLESLDELLAQHILSGKNTTLISTYFISLVYLN